MKHAPRSRLRVLLTNDDGFEALGIMALHQALVSEGTEVITIAPQSNHTAGSHRITMDGHVEVHREGIEPTYSCSGTPADCVRA